MKKIILFIYLIQSVVFATETRIKTLGGIPYFIDDDANVKIFPATIGEYSNRIIGEISSSALNYFVNLRNIIILGIGINSDTVPNILYKVIEKAPFKRFSSSPMTSFYIGKNIKNSSFGIKIAKSHNYYEKDKFLHSINLEDITIGSKIALPDFLIDFFIGKKKYSFESKIATPTGDTAYFINKNDPSLETGVRFSPIFFHKLNIIFGINYKKIDVGYEEQGNKNDFLLKSTQGYGVIKLTPYEKFSIIFGILAENEKCDTSMIETTKETFPKIAIGMETNLTEWLKIRIGSNKSYYKFKKGEEKTIDSEYNLAIGWGLNYKNFELDIMGNDLPIAKQSLGISLSYKFNPLF